MNQTVLKPSKTDPNVRSLKWKKSDSKKSAMELSDWLSHLGCGNASTPQWNDTKKFSIIQFGSSCFQSAFPFKFTTDSELMRFHSSPYQASWVKSLTLDERLRFHENEFFQFLELPLHSDSYQMVLMLPQKELSLQESAKALAKSNILTAISQLKEKRIHLKIPPFTIHQPLYSKKAILLSGLESYFKSKNAPAEVLLYFPLQVNEFGINQGSPSATNEKTDGRIHLEFYKTLEFNRPFLFALRNKTTEEILALGKVYAP
jgi:hypothetical protein